MTTDVISMEKIWENIKIFFIIYGVIAALVFLFFIMLVVTD